MLEYALTLFESKSRWYKPRSHGGHVHQHLIGRGERRTMNLVWNASYLSPWSILARLRGRLLGELGLGGTVIGVEGVMLPPV